MFLILNYGTNQKDCLKKIGGALFEM
jgi:hypothetical protein